MTEEGKKMHAFWYVSVAMYVVLGKMKRGAAEKKATNDLVELYGEEKVKKELEIIEP